MYVFVCYEDRGKCRLMFNFSDSALLLKQLDFWIEDVIILFSSYKWVLCISCF